MYKTCEVWLGQGLQWKNLANNVLEGIKRGGVYMDSQLVWQDSFNIGVEAIDKEHQRLFKIKIGRAHV